MSPQYGEIRPTNGWDLLPSLGHPYKFQRVLRLGSVTARHLVVGASQTLRRWKRAPPMFGRATITLGIGWHSSFDIFLKMLTYFFSKVTQVVGTVIRCEQFFSFTSGVVRTTFLFQQIKNLLHGNPQRTHVISYHHYKQKRTLLYHQYNIQYHSLQFQ